MSKEKWYMMVVLTCGCTAAGNRKIPACQQGEEMYLKITPSSYNVFKWYCKICEKDVGVLYFQHIDKEYHDRLRKNREKKRLKKSIENLKKL